MATASIDEQQPVAIDRFRRRLDSLVVPAMPIGIAVSGGPDSLALLLLAAEARPGLVEAATVDHALRADSRAEAEMVAALCQQRGIPHAILTVEWREKPRSAIQERARLRRFALLGQWARERSLKALLTGHHLDDQVETFLMRLARGAGVKGLAGMRRISRVPGAGVAVVRPLLGWRHAELEAYCAEAGVAPVQDPSNVDERYERVRVRTALAEADWLDPKSIAASAMHLAEADAALHWATSLEWNRGATVGDGRIDYRPGDAPREIRRRIVRRAILMLASEGGGTEPRGREIDQILAALASGRKATLRGVLCAGGPQWRFRKAPPRGG